MATKQQREELLKRFSETAEVKLWHTATEQIKLQTSIQKDKHDARTDFFRLVIDEMIENPTMFSVLRDRWNEIAVEMNLPDEIKS